MAQISDKDIETQPVEPVKRRERWRNASGLLPWLLLVPMLYPLWATPFPAFGDYWNHLLQANVVLHYDDAAFAYGASYELVPSWYLNTTALSTVVLVGLGRILPIGVAGQVLLSLYMVLFLGASKLLLDRTGNRWPLLLLAPLLAYNFTFTSGFINFCYGIALGMYALHFYLLWRERGGKRELVTMSVLLLLTAHAHVLAWLLWLVVIGAMAAVEQWSVRRLALLLCAMNSALPLLLLTRPSLGIVALLIGPALWIAGMVLRRMRISPLLIAFAGMGIALVAFQLRVSARLPAFLQDIVLPFATYNRLEKQLTALKLLTLPHQFAPPNLLLTYLNVAILTLTVLLGVLLAWNLRRNKARLPSSWVCAIGALLLGYFLLPTNTYDIVFIEPRVLLVTVLIMVVAVPPLGEGTRFKRAITFCVVALACVQSVALVHATQINGQRTALLRAQMATMAPAQNILVFYENDQRARNYANGLRLFSTVYAGQHLANLYGIEHGGLVSVTFNNGPIRFRPEIPLPEDWSGFDDAAFVAAQCKELHVYYGAVVVLLNPPSPTSLLH